MLLYFQKTQFLKTGINNLGWEVASQWDAARDGEVLRGIVGVVEIGA